MIGALINIDYQREERDAFLKLADIYFLKSSGFIFD